MTDKPEHDHDEKDGCLCGKSHAEHDVTPDDKLPPATGGVEKPRRRPTKTAVMEA